MILQRNDRGHDVKRVLAYLEFLYLAGDNRLGTLGFFTTTFMLFVRFLPMIAIAEMKAMVPHKPGLTTGGRDAHSHH